MNATLSGYLPFPATGAPQVRSAQELCTAIRTAGTRCAMPNLATMDRVLRIDARAGVVEVQGGATWAALSGTLSSQAVDGAAALAGEPARFGLPATIGECVAQNAACPDGSPFSTHVVALAVVTADGELRRATRDHHRDLFERVVGAHGMLAAVYSVTLGLQSLVAACRGAEPPVALQEPRHAGPPGDTLRYTLPPAALPAFLGALRQALDDYRLPVQALSVRKVMPDRGTSPGRAAGEQALVELRFAARATLPAEAAAQQARRALIAAALAHGGRFDLATGRDATREQVEAAYPSLKAVLAEKRRQDPLDRLGGPLYDHYRLLFQREACAVRWTRG